MQKLRATEHSDHLALEREYIKILGHYPNHTYGDYMRLAVSNIWGPTQNLESPPGRKVTIDCWDRLVEVGADLGRGCELGLILGGVEKDASLRVAIP